MLEQISSGIILVTTSLLAILSVIEKSKKIKWRPISNLFGIKKFEEKLDVVCKTLDEHGKFMVESDKKNDYYEMKRLRTYILEYSCARCNGSCKTSEDERNFDESCDDYEKLTKKYHLRNGHTNNAIKAVKELRQMELRSKYDKNNMGSEVNV